MMTAVRRTIRIRKNEQQKTNFCEKEIKRQRLVKKKRKEKNLNTYTVYLSLHLILLGSFSV